MTAGGARFSGKSVWILFEKLQLSVYQKEEQKNRPEKSDLIILVGTRDLHRVRELLLHYSKTHYGWVDGKNGQKWP